MSRFLIYAVLLLALLVTAALMHAEPQSDPALWKAIQPPPGWLQPPGGGMTSSVVELPASTPTHLRPTVTPNTDLLPQLTCVQGKFANGSTAAFCCYEWIGNAIGQGRWLFRGCAG